MTGFGRAARGILLAMIIAAAALMQADAAFAHASLIASAPADGAVIGAAPAAFTLSFSEPTAPLSLKLIGPDGAARSLDRYVLRDATLDIAAPEGLANGTYVLSWRVISEDGHPVGGSSIFSIGAPSAGLARVASEPVDWPVRIAIWAARLATYSALFLGVGGAFFAAWIGGGSAQVRRLMSRLMLAGLVAVPLSVGFQGLDALDVPLATLAQPIVWSTGFSTSFGTLAALAFAALLAGLASLATSGMSSRILAATGLALVGAAMASSGHASAAPPQMLMRPAVFLHAVAIAFWAGALMPLAAALAAGTPEGMGVLGRFSRVIPAAVLLLVAAGLVLAIVQLGGVDALWTTAYGLVLLVKLGLLVPLFALAAINRFHLTKRAERGEAAAGAGLRRSIRIEVALVVMIFAVAGAWRFTPPPRALAEAASAPAAIHIHQAKAMADLSIAPGQAGRADASIMILTGDFGPLDAKAVTLVLSNPAAGIESIRRPAYKPGDGTWRVEGLVLPVGGRWTARIDILVSDFEMVKLEDTIEIHP